MSTTTVKLVFDGIDPTDDEIADAMQTVSNDIRNGHTQGYEALEIFLRLNWTVEFSNE